MRTRPVVPGQPAPRLRRSTAAATVVVGSVLLAGLAPAGMSPASAAVVDDPITYSSPRAALALTPVGTYETGVFDESAAEIVAYYPRAERLFTVNAQAGTVDVLDASRPTEPRKIGQLEAAGTRIAKGEVVPEGAVANSVAVRPDGLGVVAVESPTKTDDGWLVFFNAGAKSLQTLGAVRVGALPDMVALSADGRHAVVANEGEPSEDYTVDPEGSVSVVALPHRVAAPAQSAVRTADFHAFEARAAGGTKALPAGVRVFGPTVNTERPVSANLEPEYVAIAGGTA